MTTTPTHLNDSAHASEAHHLPDGWHEVRVPAVAWPVVIGPGGVYVLFARDTAASFGRTDTWHGERRSASSGAQLTAALVSQLMQRATGWEITCQPVVVIDDTANLAARPDEVTVLHRRRLTPWLSERATMFDAGAVAHLCRSVGEL
ncbi:MAG: hypothetical protein KDB40_05795 [Acidimicrobiales bacterium]|nr:hypothetical protein [Acidimicrobiales bacterium]MCB9392157.1 hypothetical protein [Acidimicrobiaceae bacterium]